MPRTAAPQTGTVLPAEITTFVGRHRSAARIGDLLSTARLVTVTGTGGIGKTRLALHVARELAPGFDAGVWVTDLSTLRDPALVPHTIMATLGVADESAREPTAVLAAALNHRRLLLVLDNCEHLRDACARLVGDLLRACPRLHVLSTSRQPLGLSGEHSLVLPPLRAPDPATVTGPGDLHDHDAVRLFLDRATAVLPDFRLTPDNARDVAALCTQLDGLPLAIELAAVRLRALSVRQILQRLDRRYQLLNQGDTAARPRQRTLRGLIDWSHDLCSPDERRLWARLSVFSGGFELEAAEEVCSCPDLPRDRILDTLAALVEKSILVREEHDARVRYRLLETIRQYGAERLAADAGTTVAVRRRHRDHYLRLVESGETGHTRALRAGPHGRTHREQANLRVALDFCLTTPGEAETGLRMAAALWLHWRALNLLTEGRRWFDRLLDAESTATVSTGAPAENATAAENGTPAGNGVTTSTGAPAENRATTARANALWANAWLAALQGDFDQVTALLTECELLGRRLGDTGISHHVTDMWGLVALFRGDFERTLELVDTALTGYRERDDAVSSALALLRLAQAAFALGDHSRARAVASECLARCRTLGATWVMTYPLWILGIVTWETGDTALAVEHEREAVRTARSHGDRLGGSLAVQAIAWMSAQARDARFAAMLLGATRRIWSEIGAPLPHHAHLAPYQDRCVLHLETALGTGRLEAYAAEGERLPDQAVFEMTETGATPPAGGTADDFAACLTPREREIADLVAQGLSNPEIARRLVISSRTAETHVQHILTKLGFTSRIQIATWVTREGTPT
ncbi:LuxR C-terminal-related transcriptional regulator [Streptosporangium longisporum]|uniref:LuxR family transcriptional regulator n=1 Tax=Streptosporangium longisporum TaxID=46187 RepID=A0ABN3XQX8_9ACTN